jgi:hypothetical protein
MHQAALAVIVIEGKMLGAQVIPERYGAGPPIEGAGEFGPGCVRIQIIQQGPALGLGHISKADGKAPINIEVFAARIRMGANHRMFDLFQGDFRQLELRIPPFVVVLGLGTKGADAAVYRFQA